LINDLPANGKQSMRGKEVLFALVCALTGAALAYVIRVAWGSWPSPVVYYSMIVIGLGGALVTVRYGRLGPFEGEFGPPGVETQIREQLSRETSRAMRFGREFTVLAVRPEGRASLDWSRAVRLVDQVIYCRRGVVLVLLPETTVEGGMMLLRRVSGMTDVPLRAVLVNWPDDGRTGDELARHLLKLIREQGSSGEVVIYNGGNVTTRPITV
jgi:hypothetical protein